MGHAEMTEAPITEARLRCALVAAAYIVTTHGDVYAPIFERLEREHEQIKREQDPLSRARRLLSAHVESSPRALLPSSDPCVEPSIRSCTS